MECGIRTCAEVLFDVTFVSEKIWYGILCGPNSLLIKSLAQTFRGLLHNYNILLALFAYVFLICWGEKRKQDTAVPINRHSEQTD